MRVVSIPKIPRPDEIPGESAISIEEIESISKALTKRSWDAHDQATGRFVASVTGDRVAPVVEALIAAGWRISSQEEPCRSRYSILVRKP